MVKYLFNEAVLREDARRGSYFLRYLPWLVISAALAIIPWMAGIVAKITFFGQILEIMTLLISGLPVNFPQGFTPDICVKILISVVFGVIFILLLLFCIKNTKIPRLVITKNRVCLVKRPNKYYEVRYDEIDAFIINRHTLKIYTGGRKVFAFGPLADVFTTRDVITVILENRYVDEEKEAKQVNPASASEPEPIDQTSNVFPSSTTSSFSL